MKMLSAGSVIFLTIRDSSGACLIRHVVRGNERRAASGYAQAKITQGHHCALFACLTDYVLAESVHACWCVAKCAHTAVTGQIAARCLHMTCRKW